MKDKNDVRINWGGYPVTSGGTNENGQAYQKEEYDRDVYVETYTKTTSKTGSSVQKYHDKTVRDD